MKQTKNCIVCGCSKIAKIGGHVHKENETIVACFCKEHKQTEKVNNSCKGCYGEWKYFMGEDSSFGMVCHIDSDVV